MWVEANDALFFTMYGNSSSSLERFAVADSATIHSPVKVKRRLRREEATRGPITYRRTPGRPIFAGDIFTPHGNYNSVSYLRVPGQIRELHMGLSLHMDHPMLILDILPHFRLYLLPAVISIIADDADAAVIYAVYDYCLDKSTSLWSTGFVALQRNYSRHVNYDAADFIRNSKQNDTVSIPLNVWPKISHCV